MCSEKEGDIMTQTMTALEVAPGPFESESLPGNGIVNCRDDEPKGHCPNTVFRRVLHTRATRGGFKRATEE